MLSWPNNATLREIRTRAATNLTHHPHLVDTLYHASPQTPFLTRSGALYRFVTCCNCTLPNISIQQCKAGDRPGDLEIILQSNGGGRPASFQFPSSPTGSLLRCIVAASLLPEVSVGHQELSPLRSRSQGGQTDVRSGPDPARRLVALLRREDGAPKDPLWDRLDTPGGPARPRAKTRSLSVETPLHPRSIPASKLPGWCPWGLGFACSCSTPIG